MKNFIIKLIFTFILPLFLLLFAVEWCLRSIPNDYKFKDKMITAKCDSIKVLSFGSSHGHYGIRPDCMSLPAFNIGMPSQSVKYDHFLFYKFIDRCPNLKCVILPVSYFSLTSELEAGAGWAHAKGYSIYMGYDEYKFSPIYNFELINKEKYLGLVKMIGRDLTFVTCDSLGWGCKREYGDQKPNFTSFAQSTVEHHNSSIGEPIDENVKRIKEIITTCGERDIKVILLTTPTHESYYSLLEEGHVEFVVKTCQNLAAEFSNTTYVNFLKDSSFVEEDFYDPDHLNTTGATKLTKMLDEVIIELGVRTY
jgi:hypothetical protein